MIQKTCIALEKAKEPICQQCIQNEVISWIRRRNPRLVPVMRSVAKSFFTNAKYSNKIVCAICNKRFNACDFCFKKHIRGWIEKNQPKLLAEFRLFFDSGRFLNPT